MSVSTPTEAVVLTPYQGKLEFDRQVDARFEELLIEGGYSKEDAEGNDVPDLEAFKRQGALILAGHEINKVEDRPKGLTATELLEKVLPDVAIDLTDAVDEAAWKKLARRIWGITQPGPSGYAQRLLPQGFVLVRPSVVRLAGPKAPPQKVRVAFVTSNDDMIIDDSFMPVVDEVIAGANKIRKQAELIVTRKPELGQRITKAITSATQRVASDARMLNAGDAA